MYAVTGANGHLGMRLLPVLAELGPVRALVRSRSAAEAVGTLGLGEAVAVRVVDYHDAAAVGDALAGCAGVAHLVGIIKETPGNRYREAHEGACAALVAAADRAGVAHLAYLSLLGAAPDAANPCLASRGAAERILLNAPLHATVLRVPMVLGEGDYAAAALAKRARRRCSVILRGSSLEQPIYAGDVVAALLAALGAGREAPRPVQGGVLELAGPECLTRRALIHRAAQVLGRRTRVLALPAGAGFAAAAVLEGLSSHPPVTRAMLGVLDHDDRVDTAPALAALGISLTPLNETLRQTLVPGR